MDLHEIVHDQNRLFEMVGHDIVIDEQNPLFAEVSLYDASQDDPEYVNAVAYANGVAAIVQLDGVFVHMDMLKCEPSRYASIMIPPERYSRVVVPLGFVGISIMNSTEELRGMYSTMVNRRKAGNYTVSARLFEGAGYNMAAPVMIGSEQEWDLSDAKLNDGRRVDSVDGAITWLIENHPDYYMGAVIEGKVNGMRTAIIPSPARAPAEPRFPGGRDGIQNDYKEGSYEDYRKRRLYIKMKAEGRNLKLGPKEYAQVWTALTEMGGPDDEDDG